MPPILGKPPAMRCNFPLALAHPPPRAPEYSPRMLLKWLLSIVIVVAVLGGLQPLLARHFRLGRLPGDLTVRRGGRDWHLPFTSTVLMSLLAWLILRWL